MLKQSVIRKPRLKYRIPVTVKIKVHCCKAVNDKETKVKYRVPVTVKVKVYCVKAFNDKETQVKIQGSSNSKNKGILWKSSQ